MTINLTDPANHPANGPLTVERITRLIAELRRSLEYQNGGDMAYVIADAIKGLEELLVSREAAGEPVAWTEKCEITNMQATGLYLRGFPNNSQGRDIPLYTAPPAPLVPCPFPCGWDNLNRLAIQDSAFVERGLVEGEIITEAHRQAAVSNNYRLLKVISACRDAMLQAGNSPATPDSWIPVSERMPDPQNEFRVCVFTPTPHEDLRYRFVSASLFKSVCRDATHWHYMMPPKAL